jgi:Protein of unknown function (DUF3891)
MNPDAPVTKSRIAPGLCPARRIIDAVLLRTEGDAVIAIGQASHAWISGQLARVWGNERIPAPEPRDAVCLAAEQHDVGMAGWDLRPALNPDTGRPQSFLELPVPVHVGLWTAAPGRLLTQSRYAALLVSMHGTALYAHRNTSSMSPVDRELVEGYLDAQHAFQDDLAARIGADRAQLRRNQQLLWTWDAISLALCLRWDPLALAEVPAPHAHLDLDLELRALGADRFALCPWPFAAESVRVQCEGVRLEERYDSEPALQRALRLAPIVALEFVLEPTS